MKKALTSGCISLTHNSMVMQLNGVVTAQSTLPTYLATCTLSTDWKSDDPMEGAWGLFVSDPNGTDQLVEEQAWTYTWYETDEDLNPLTIFGSYGNIWYFTTEVDFHGGETCYKDNTVGDDDGDGDGDGDGDCDGYGDLDDDCDSDHQTFTGYYDSNPDSCGVYDTEDFISSRECCICGGGSHMEQETRHSDDSIGDVDGNTCTNYYDINLEPSGGFHTNEFIATRECCIFGGGSTGYQDDSFEYQIHLNNPFLDGIGIVWVNDGTFHNQQLVQC